LIKDESIEIFPGCEWWDRVFVDDEPIETMTCSIDTDINQLPSQAREKAQKEYDRFSSLSVEAQQLELSSLLFILLYEILELLGLLGLVVLFVLFELLVLLVLLVLFTTGIDILLISLRFANLLNSSIFLSNSLSFLGVSFFIITCPVALL
jgi:hypothetical protein